MSIDHNSLILEFFTPKTIIFLKSENIVICSEEKEREMAKLGPSGFNKFLPDTSNSPEFLNSDQKMEYRRKTRRGKKKGKHHRGKFIDAVMDISIESSKCVGCKRKVEEKRDFYSNLSKKLKMCDKCRKLFPPQQLWSNDDCMLALTEIAERDDQPCQQRPHSVMDHCTNTCEFDWKDSLLDLPLHFDETHELMCLETDSFNNYRVDDCTESRLVPA